MADQETALPEQTSRQDPLILSVASAVYDQDEQLASIKLTKAFQKSHAIQKYDGDDITLTYQNNPVSNPDDCPKIDIALSDIERSISYLGNSVTLTLANVSQQQADLIDQAQCFRIDTETAQTITDPSWSTPKM